MTTHLHIDAPDGIAGDMFLGAAVDLGVPVDAIDAALRPLNIQPDWTITTERVTRHGITGINLRVPTEHHHHHDDHDHDHHHHHTTACDILAMIEQLDVPDRAKQRARRIVTVLGEAEAAVHETTFDKVHFHEVGAVDSIVDMLGAAVALEMLGVETISAGSLPIGHGFVDCAHGRLPLPAPATAAILQRIAHHDVDVEGETVTPTGAALVAALADDFGDAPPLTDPRTGHGAGDREAPTSPNMLRLVIGDKS